MERTIKGLNKLTTGLIMLEDNHHFIYKVARIDYVQKGKEFEYIISPYYEIIDFIPNNIFHGIPGIDLSLRKDHYIRKNFIPTFISERTPNNFRDDLHELLNSCHMHHLNRLEWLIRTNTRYHGDNLYVEDFLEYPKKTLKVNSMYNLGNNITNVNKALLNAICMGDDIISPEITINDETRHQYYKYLMTTYIKDIDLKKKRQKKGIDKAKETGIYKGRAPITINDIDATLREFDEGIISETEAILNLAISRSTFYRRLKAFRNSDDI